MLIVALASLRTRWTTLVGTFVALALGVGLIAVMGLGLASAFGAPDRAPQRFAGSPVVVMGDDTLTVEVRRGPSTGRVSRRLAHPHPVDIELLRDLRALGPVTRDDRNGARGGPNTVGVDAPVTEVRRVVGDRALVLTGDDRRRADPATERDAEGAGHRERPARHGGRHHRLRRRLRHFVDLRLRGGSRRCWYARRPGWSGCRGRPECW
ncbi:hypothetical protein ACFVT1_06825 [Streptomyces sp. NPDC057963]|uniref:hypothetical protein n=1 Tax=Streptomyces sp. NPDC057963 TaxID=3346290 RepID=UPI0036E7DD40